MDIHSNDQEKEIQGGIVGASEPIDTVEENIELNNVENIELNNAKSIELNNAENIETNNALNESRKDKSDKTTNLDKINIPNKKDEPVNLKKEIRGMIIYFLVVILVVFFVKHFIGEQVRVEGMSMESTLHNYERLILEKLSYRFGDPERFDIIVFQPYPDNRDELYIKRIIGLPGDKVKIIGNDIYINDEIIDENYGKDDTINEPGIAQDSIVLADDEYFVMGDNRNHSTDSRAIGPIKKSSILGRAWVRIWPFNKVSVLEHK